MSVESAGSGPVRGGAPIELRMLGPLAVLCEGVPLVLPASRKVRALLAYLALAPHAVARGQLCDLLWDVADDPRGELRWCLSKLRGIVDAPGRRRVETSGDAVALDLADCFVDAAEIVRADRDDIAAIAPERLRALAALFRGDFLEGLEIERSLGFESWLAAQRRRFRFCHAAVLEHLVASAPGDEASRWLDALLELAPFDQSVHERLLTALVRRGRIREAEEHLAATARLFEAEGLECASLRETWRSLKSREDGAPRVPVAAAAPLPEAAGIAPEDVGAIASRRASIAVMPFVDRSPGAGSAPGAGGATAEGLAHDVITRLAKLRSLFVIAHGTVFALHERHVGPEEAGRMLNVDYVVGGSLQRHGRRLTASVELVETRSSRIVWAETFDHRADALFLVLDEIGDRIVASIASEIETIERNRAILKPPDSLDAWEAHHRGLWHMYRFTRADNDRAQHFFETAARLDPTFSRAHAGLSFTHWQNAFQGWSKREPEIERAYAAAGQSLMADDRDPAAHWAMGRALWLRGSHDQSVVELAQAVDLSPNFALGHYNLAFVNSTAGDASAAISSSDHSRELSPFDPMLFGMLGARAMALLRLQKFEEAAAWGVKAAARPNAFAHILAIAAFSLALAGRLDEARSYLATIRKALPQYGVDDFLTAMQFDPEGAALVREAANRIGGE